MMTSTRRVRRIGAACALALVIIAVAILTRHDAPVVMISLPGESAAFLGIDAGRADFLLHRAAAGFSDGRRIMFTVGRPYRPRRPLWVTPSLPASGTLTSWHAGVDPDDQIGFQLFDARAGFGATLGRPNTSMMWFAIPPWVPLGCLALYAAWQGLALLQARRRPRDACPGCGYLLRHLGDSTDRCPECGRPIDRTAAAQ